MKSSLLSVVRLQTVVDEELAWLEVRKTALLLPSYTTALASIEKAMATHNKALAKRSDEIEGAIKKTEVELEDKEQSLSVKSTKKGKKEVETLHNKKDNQALFLDLFEHYKDELVDHVKEAKDLKE